MHFASPQILWLLLVLPPALVAFFWWSWRKRQALMTRFIQARLLPGLVSGLSSTRQKIRFSCLVLAVVCIIFALARPQWGFAWQEVKQRGVDIVVALDVSKSMLATDIAPSRLERAKLAALDLMQQAKSDRLGLVGFAGSAFLQCPLTIDDAAFRQSVEALNVNSISQGGTAIADAIETALTAYKEGDNHKILVLMTDGEDQDSGALEAAKKAAEAGLRIYTIGIGTPEGDLIRVTDAKGASDYVRDEQGNVVKSHLNEPLLREIAGATDGGFYLPLRGAKTIDMLYSEGLAKLPKSEHQEKFVRQYNERFRWPLGLAMLLLLTEMFLPERRRAAKAEAKRGVNETRPARSRSPAPLLKPGVALVAGLLLLSLPGPVFGSPSAALREYRAGNYEQALKDYEQLLQSQKDDPRLHFNAGAAAYRNQQFEEAAKQFNQALQTPDLKLQQSAYFNRGNTLYRLGEANPDSSKRTESWEQALKDFDRAGRLESNDADARFNYDYVKRKLEELKQQQQQKQDKQDKSGQKNQDQQSQNQQNNQSKQDQAQQQQAQQNQSGQKQDAAQQNQQQQQQQGAKPTPDQQQKPQPQPQEQDQQQAGQASAEANDKTDEKQDETAYAASHMTPDQARQLMDSQKGQEKMLIIQPDSKPADRSRPLRDW
jgi:Ca-activated chloride channel family protein